MKPGTLFAVVLLAIVAFAHLMRLLFGVQVTLADRIVPMWVSGVAVLVAGGVALTLWRESRRRG